MSKLEFEVDGVILDGDWGDQRGIMLGPERWRRFIKPRLARLYERIRRAGKYTLHHSCGNVRDVIPDLIEIGLDVLQSVQPEAMDPHELKREFGKDLCLLGWSAFPAPHPFQYASRPAARFRPALPLHGKG